jgi:alkanesulfonate monooxygenase SsuD/methylene tetrahydromethanopterin reductase-like flavin-dependent oxidoreductase (luciferase family)
MGADVARFCFFHLMPYAELDESSDDWPISNEPFDPARGTQLYQTYIEQMAFAEECGFDWVGCNEHHFSPYGLMSNPNLIGAVLAQRTKRARLAMLGNLVPLLNPVRVAEEYAMLDVLSGGRLIAGFMRGIAHEYAAYNVPPDDSWSRLREAYELIVKAWTEPEPFRWEGEHYQFRSVSIWPRPVQRPHPRILMSGGSVDSAEFAAKKRAIMGIVQLENLEVARANADVYREAARSAGWEPQPEDVLVGLHTCIAETDEEAHELLSRAEAYFYSVLSGGPRTAQRIILQKTRYHGERAAKYQAERRARLKAMTLDDRIDAGTVLCGSPKTVVDQIRRVTDAVGNGVFNVNFKIGRMPNEAVTRGMQLFRDQVLPEVRDL